MGKFPLEIFKGYIRRNDVDLVYLVAINSLCLQFCADRPGQTVNDSPFSWCGLQRGLWATYAVPVDLSNRYIAGIREIRLSATDAAA